MNCAFPSSRFPTGLRRKRLGIRLEEIEGTLPEKATTAMTEDQPVMTVDVARKSICRLLATLVNLH